MSAQIGSRSWPKQVGANEFGGAKTSYATSASWPAFRRLENICQQGVKCHTPLTRTTATLGTLDPVRNGARRTRQEIPLQVRGEG